MGRVGRGRTTVGGAKDESNVPLALSAFRVELACVTSVWDTFVIECLGRAVVGGGGVEGMKGWGSRAGSGVLTYRDYVDLFSHPSLSFWRYC